MPSDIQIEQMKLSDLDAVLSFLAETYPDNPRLSDPEFWRWHFASDPDNIPVWLAWSGDRIAGHLGLTPVDLRIGDSTVRSAWMLDMMAHPDFRRRGMMKDVVRRLYEIYPVLLGVATDEQYSPVLLRSIGWQSLRRIPRFHKLLFPANDIRQIARHPPLVSLLNVLYSPLRPRLADDLFAKGSKLRHVDKFDETFEELWAETRGHFKCAAERAAAMLTWQFRKQPGKKYDVIGYYDNERLLGWAVLFFRKPGPAGLISKASISDICYHPQHSDVVIDALLDGCIKMAIDRKCGGLVTDIIDRTIEQRLKQKGFWTVKSTQQLLVWSRDQRSAVLNADSWFLTRGDSDISVFEAPNL